MVRKRAVFLDRDGVLNIPRIYKNKSYAPLRSKDFKLYPGVKKYCIKLKKNFLLIVITNQPDLTKGILTYSELKKMHEQLYMSINYDDLFFCSAISNKSYFKKPNPGMLTKAISKYKINPKKSYLIGDRWSDIEAGEKVGCKTVFIDRHYNEQKPLKFDFKTKSFIKAAKYILNDQN